MNKKESQKKYEDKHRDKKIRGNIIEDNNLNENIKNSEKNMKNSIKKNNSQKKKKKHKFGRIFLRIVLIIIIIIAAFVGYSTFKNGWGLQGILQTAMGQDKHTLENLKPLTILIMGLSKDIDVELTDTIIVASYNPKEQKAVLLSIPRDTFTGKNKNKASASEKINALYQKSPDKTLNAVNEITGLNIEKYIVIDNKALIQLVDAIGGVEFDVPIDMDYDDVTQDLYIHLTKGYQKLDGEQAEQLVRFRKNNNGTTYPSEYGDNDIGRMRTQREFLKVVAKQTISLKNITKIGDFIDILKQNVKTNITNWDEIKKYIPYAVNFSMENLENASLPGDSAMYNKLWFFVYDKNETQKLLEELFTTNKEEDETLNSSEENIASGLNDNSNTSLKNTEKKEEKIESNSKSDAKNNEKKFGSVEKQTVKIEVLNGSNNSKKLTEVTNILKEKGYNVYITGTTTSTSKTTILNKSQIDNEFIEELKSDLGKGAISNSNSGNKSDCDITVIIGKDF